MKKHVIFFLLIIGVITLVSIVSSPASSRGKSGWGHVTFTTHKGKLKFFDHGTGKIFVYSEGNGKINRVWHLEELGKDLKNITRTHKGNT